MIKFDKIIQEIKTSRIKERKYDQQHPFLLDLPFSGEPLIANDLPLYLIFSSSSFLFKERSLLYIARLSS